jgi:hypothetical protein
MTTPLRGRVFGVPFPGLSALPAPPDTPADV